MDGRASLGAEDNAAWCDAMTRTHGGSGVFARGAWTSPTRTPALHPDAVTLSASVSVDDLLSRIDTAAGCSVKDSFGSVDLGDHGFRVLFDAQWIWASAGPAGGARSPSGWHRVTDAAGLRRWSEAWAGDGGVTDLFRPALLDLGWVEVLAHVGGDGIVAGAVLTVGSGAVGLSNLFTSGGDAGRSWADVVGWVRARHPDLPLVGYEAGEALAVARETGFEAVGPLRVWVTDD